MVVLPLSVHLVVSSPPYNIGKEYEKSKTVEEYITWAESIIAKLDAAIKPGGMVCWQVGNYIEKDGSILPLDEVYSPIFRRRGYRMRNRLIWRVGHGLHCNKRLSGRYEVLLCFAKPGAEPTFNLDDVRVPTKYPGKRAYRGASKGMLSGNPAGGNPSDVWELLWTEHDSGVMDIPSVRNNHVEKMEHPCQFPVELAERCVLLYSNEGDVVLDPFAGSGTTLVAAEFHGRRGIGCDYTKSYCDIANRRLEMVHAGTLKTRVIGTPIATAGLNTKTRAYPEEWKTTLEEARMKKRMVRSPLQEYTDAILDHK